MNMRSIFCTPPNVAGKKTKVEGGRMEVEGRGSKARNDCFAFLLGPNSYASLDGSAFQINVATPAQTFDLGASTFDFLLTS
jgi:hypothetical protein